MAEPTGAAAQSSLAPNAPSSVDGPRSRCRSAIAKLASELREPMTITLFHTKSTLPKFEAAVRSTQAALQALAEGSAGKLVARSVEVANESDRKLALDRGLQEVTFGEVTGPNEQASIFRGVFGLSFDYRAERQVIPVLSPDRSPGLEFWIANKIREARAEADAVTQTVGVVAKKGTTLDDPFLIPSSGTGPSPTIQRIMQQAVPYYRFVAVDLDHGKAAVDPELPGLLVLQADEDWTDRELARIDEFLMRGDKTVMVFAGAVAMPAHDPGMRARLDTRRFDRLLSGYGLELRPAMVLDPSGAATFPLVRAGGSPETVAAPGVLLLTADQDVSPAQRQLDDTSPIFFRLAELALPYPSPLVLHPERQPRAMLRVLARSSERAWEVQQANLALRPRVGAPAPATGPSDRFALAATVEGTLRSAWAASPLEGMNVPGESTRPSRLLVVASPQFLANPFARASAASAVAKTAPVSKADQELGELARAYAQRHLTATILAFKNGLDWMTAQQDMVVCATLVPSLPPEAPAAR